MKKSLMVALVVLTFVFSALNFSCWVEAKLTEWNIYRGKITGYDVEINETYRGVWGMIVHLHAVGKPSYVGITGHIYGKRYDGRLSLLQKDWDKVFYCGNPGRPWAKETMGCNSVLRTTRGWKFEPCDADKGMEPFTDKEINFAMEQLDKAMQTVYNLEHRTSTLEDWNKRFEDWNKKK
jgi:hypothetical protein